MYSIQPYTGSDLPSKCLCLTYDDGPGKDTYAIAQFLHDQNIQATFFVVGKYACHHTDILEKVTALGHLIANHTYEHPDMPYYLSVNGDVHNQILRTDAIIRKYIAGNTVYFRCPYGKWSPEVANELNLNALSTVSHLGPIHWDIGGVDCFHWKNGETVDFTVNKYLEDINRKDHGIVVMHDEIADMDFLKEKNQTLELTKRLVPLLKDQGYTFIRLDDIPSIKNDAAKPFSFKLKNSNGQFLALSDDNKTISFQATSVKPLNELTMEEVGNGKVALRASSGLYLSWQANNGDVVEAVSNKISTNETFDLIPFSSYQIAFRAYNGNYLTRENKNGGRLVATAVYMRGCERFTFLPANSQVKKKISLRKEYKMIKRQILYVKSKIQQGV